MIFPDFMSRWFSSSSLEFSERCISFFGNNHNQKKHPRRLRWNIIMEVWKIIFLSKWVICRFHVNLPGWNSSPQKKHRLESAPSLGSSSSSLPLFSCLLRFRHALGLGEDSQAWRHDMSHFPLRKIHGMLVYIHLPAPSKGCQMVPKGCQFTIP